MSQQPSNGMNGDPAPEPNLPQVIDIDSWIIQHLDERCGGWSVVRNLLTLLPRKFRGRGLDTLESLRSQGKVTLYRSGRRHIVKRVDAAGGVR